MLQAGRPEIHQQAQLATRCLEVRQQLGLVGSGLLLWFYFRLFRLLRSTYLMTRDIRREPWLLGLVTATAVLIMDFCIYSVCGLFLGVLTPVFFYMVALGLKEQGTPAFALS